MILSLPLSPAFRFAQFVRVLCAALDRRVAEGAMARSFANLLWCRLQEMGQRFARLAAQVQAGKLPPPAEPASRAGQASRPRGLLYAPLDVLADGGLSRVPGWMQSQSGWLVEQVPEAAEQTEALLGLIGDAEVLALAVASPGIARMLRSACRMLGVEPVAELRLPKRARPPKPARAPRPKAWEPPLHLPSVGGGVTVSKRLRALIERRRQAAEDWEKAAENGARGE